MKKCLAFCLTLLIACATIHTDLEAKQVKKIKIKKSNCVSVNVCRR